MSLLPKCTCGQMLYCSGRCKNFETFVNEFQSGKDFIDEMPVPEYVKEWIDKNVPTDIGQDNCGEDDGFKNGAEKMWHLMYRQLHSCQQTAKIEVEHRDKIISDLRASINDFETRLKELTEWVHGHM